MENLKDKIQEAVARMTPTQHEKLWRYIEISGWGIAEEQEIDLSYYEGEFARALELLEPHKSHSLENLMGEMEYMFDVSLIEEESDLAERKERQLYKKISEARMK